MAETDLAFDGLEIERLLEFILAPRNFPRAADYKSAIQQSTTLRYEKASNSHVAPRFGGKSRGAILRTAAILAAARPQRDGLENISMLPSCSEPLRPGRPRSVFWPRLRRFFGARSRGRGIAAAAVA